MLRTHNELSYKQEQRFHLELGLLKLVHAQRLLPLEELLSGEAAKPAGTPAPRGGSSSLPPARVAPPASRPAPARSPEVASASRPASPFTKPSPFESDRSRKSEPKSDVSQSVSMVSTATATAVAIEPEPPPPSVSEPEVTLDVLRGAVLDALESSGQQMLAHNLEQGEWLVQYRNHAESRVV